MNETLQTMISNDWKYFHKSEKFNFLSNCAGDITRDASRSGRSHRSVGREGGEGGDVSDGDHQ